MNVLLSRDERENQTSPTSDTVSQNNEFSVNNAVHTCNNFLSKNSQADDEVVMKNIDIGVSVSEKIENDEREKKIGAPNDNITYCTYPSIPNGSADLCYKIDGDIVFEAGPEFNISSSCVNKDFMEFDAGPEFNISSSCLNKDIMDFDSGPQLKTHSCGSRETDFKRYLEKDEKLDELESTFERLGNRHVNLGHVLKIVTEIADNENHHEPNCENGKWELADYNDKGGKTLVYLQCNECKSFVRFSTHPDKKEQLDPNYAYVLGCLTSGISYSNAKEMRAAQGIPDMSPETFRKYQEQIVLDSLNLSKQCMAESAKKEADIARKKNHVAKNGVPFITVVADGSWAKRSMGGLYNSLSGCIVIIGFETGEPIDIIFRNKACATCDRAVRENREAKEHVCFKNFERSKSSGAMETEAIVEGFTTSIQKYGLIYKYLIADGDSSVHTSILDVNPYKDYDIVVQKIDCVNHLLRNACKKIRQIANTRTPYNKAYKGITALRATVSNSSYALRQEIVKAVEKRREGLTSTTELQERCKLLYQDIINVPYHLFGDHKKCKSLNWTCEHVENEVSLVHDLQQAGLFEEIEKALLPLKMHAECMLYNETNNVCESFHNLLCKANAGKRINFGMRGGYVGRCSLQVLRTTKKAVLSQVYQSKGIPTPDVITKMEHSRQLQVERNRQYNLNRNSKAYNQMKDKDYGEQAMKPDVSKEKYDQLVTEHMDKLEKNQKNRENVFIDTKEQSNSPLWHLIRRNLVTASFFGEICKMRDTTSCCDVVKKIVYPRTANDPRVLTALLYGSENESSAIKQLKEEYNVTVEPSGLVIDPLNKIFAGSPDGFIKEELEQLTMLSDLTKHCEDTEYIYETVCGGIVEIKCPLRAKHFKIEDAIENIKDLRSVYDKKNVMLMNRKHNYFYQVQGDLHVSRRKYCLFVMWSPHSIKVVVVMRDDSFWKSCMEEKLERFFMECLLPEMVDGRLNRNLDIRNPVYITEAKEKQKTLKLEKEEKSNLRMKRKTDEIYLDVEGNNYDIIIETKAKNEDQEVIAAQKKQKTLKRKSNSRRKNYTNSNAELKKYEKFVMAEATNEDIEVIAVHEQTETCLKRFQNDQCDEDIELIGIYEPTDNSSRRLNDDLFDTIPISEFSDLILSSNGWLDTVCINRFLNVLRRQSNFDLLNVQYMCHPELIPSFKSKDIEDVQIIGGLTSNHWRCIYFDGNLLHILDSLGPKKYEPLPLEEQKYIQKRYPTLKSTKITTYKCTLQPDDHSCGIYAAATVVAILLGMNPYKVKHSQNTQAMREHFLNIIETEKIIAFPQDNKIC